MAFGPFPACRRDTIAIFEPGLGFPSADWAASPLGPPERWEPELAAAVRTCLGTSFPMLVLWGPELAAVPNDAFAAMLGTSVVGRPAAEVWPDVWPLVDAVVRGVLRDGVPARRDDLGFILSGDGRTGEAYFTFAHSPIMAAGSVGGVLTVATETTARVLATRRMRALDDLGAVRGTDVERVCDEVALVLDRHRADLPFGVLYLPDPAGCLVPVASHGLARGVPDAALRPAERAARAGTRTMWADVPPGVTAPGHGLGDPEPGAAVALPLEPGVLLVGLNPLLPLDRDYSAYLDLVARQVSGEVRGLLDVVTIRAPDRDLDHELRTALVDALQDGFFVATADGTIVEVNQAFVDMLGFTADPRLPWPMPHPWWPDDPAAQTRVADAMAELLANGTGRFLMAMRREDGRRIWVDMAVDTLRDDDPARRLIVGTMRDVTDQHLAAERDTTVARLADRLTGIEDHDAMLAEGLAELRSVWPTGRVTVGTSTSADAASAPIGDGPDPLRVWLEFATPRPSAPDDQALLTHLCDHLRRALRHARAYDEQRTVALALQRALLGPTDLPPGFAVRYEPAGDTLEVGGDWYDVIPLPGGKHGVVVGDVVGRGLPAATVMGQLRSATRALLLEDKNPAETLRSLDRFAALLPAAQCTTVFCAVIDPAGGTLTYSCAGHPPAIVSSPGATTLLTGARSIPLGVLADAERTEVTVPLPSGATLLLYTDGLVERRDAALDEGFARAAAALSMAPGTDPADIVTHLGTTLLTDDHSDDVAYLVYRTP